MLDALSTPEIPEVKPITHVKVRRITIEFQDGLDPYVSCERVKGRMNGETFEAVDMRADCYGRLNFDFKPLVEAIVTTHNDRVVKEQESEALRISAQKKMAEAKQDLDKANGMK